MSATVADLNPKTLENAKRQFVELYGSALVMNTYLKIALFLISLLALGLLALNFRTQALYANVNPLVVRIDEVGRAEAVQYDTTRYQPQAPELRYFLTQFVVKHFSRIRATVKREYPDSLFFLEPSLADATIAQNDQSRSLETFLTKQMELIKARNPAALGSTLAALKVIGDRGSASALPVLNAIASTDVDPAILAAANAALVQVLARQPVK